jgi:hypothetical protein
LIISKMTEQTGSRSNACDLYSTCVHLLFQPGHQLPSFSSALPGKSQDCTSN